LVNIQKLRENLRQAKPVHITKSGQVADGRGNQTTLKPTRFG
jgi:hypothetical protein